VVASAEASATFAMHSPARQASPLEHTVPQAPQLLPSELVVVQRPEQLVSPATHETAQCPVPSHTWPAAQTVPQAPQF